ncbi:hypothetical protein [Xenorhabdus sp. TS4]|nr:hypothetical protein [Xenorhabdus sp. TS4]
MNLGLVHLLTAQVVADETTVGEKMTTLRMSLVEWQHILLNGLC